VATRRRQECRLPDEQQLSALQVDRNSMVGSKHVNGKSLETKKFFALPRQELRIDWQPGKLDTFPSHFKVLLPAFNET